MSPRIKNVLTQSIGALIAAGLTYLALRNVDFSGMWLALERANYWWLIPLVAGTLVAHLLRSWRWRMFVDALPESERTDGAARPSLTLAFNSVMIGYMINNAVPRLGEFARAANMSSQGKLRFSGVFGTVVVERVLDMVCLMIILVGVALLVAGSEAAETVFFGPLRDRVQSVGPIEIAIVLAIVAAAVFGLVKVPSLLRRRHGSDGLLGRLAPMIDSFRAGFLTLFKSRNRLGIAITTLAIWIAYWLMLYLPFHMLHMSEQFGLGWEAAFVLLGIGSLGFVVPAPGGIGAYHYFVIQTLVQLYATPNEVAASFAVLTHAAQLVLFSVVGFLCLVSQGSSLSSMMRIARDAKEHSGDEPSAPSPPEGYISH